MKFAIILFTSLLLFTACGSGGGQETSDPALVALQLAESVDEQLGADNGFNAIIYAWERGYSNSQLFNAIDHTRLLGNGFLATLVSGYQVPAGPALGLVLLPEEAHHHFRSVAFISLEDSSAIRRIAAGTRAVDKVPVGQVLEAASNAMPDLQQKKEYIAVLFLLTQSQGYSAAQIIEVILFGAMVDRESYENLPKECEVFLRDLTGQIIEPDSDAQCKSEYVDLARTESLQGESQTTNQMSVLRPQTKMLP